MSIGLLMFMLMLTFAVQLLFNLYATSVVTGLAIEAARDVAELDGPLPAEAEQEFQTRVGPAASIQIQDLGTEVRADVQYTSPSVFPAVFNSQPFGVIDRTFVVRAEEQQPAGP